jgi:hypothetical protein
MIPHFAEGFGVPFDGAGRTVIRGLLSFVFGIVPDLPLFVIVAGATWTMLTALAAKGWR